VEPVGRKAYWSSIDRVGGVVMNAGYRKRMTTVRSMIRVRTEVIEKPEVWVLRETICGTGRMDAYFNCIEMVEDASDRMMRWVIGWQKTGAASQRSQASSSAVIWQNTVTRFFLPNWATTWQLKLTINKCQHIYISLFRTAVLPKFSLSGNTSSSCSLCRDFGIIIDSSLSFIEHINSIDAEAHMWASQILRCFLSRDPLILIRAFNVYVQRIVEYCSPVWSLTAVRQINKLNRCRGG